MGKEYTRSFSVLGSSPVYGNQNILEDFTITPYFIATGTGTSFSYHRSISYPFSCRPSYYIATRSATPAEDDYVSIIDRIYISKSPFFRLQLAFLTPDVSDLKYICFYPLWYEGATLYTASIRYDVANSKWQYLDTADNWQDITDGAALMYDLSWNFIDFSVDLANHTFISLVHDNIFCDMSGIPLKSVALAVGTLLELQIRIITSGAAMGELYLAPILITNS